MRTATLSTFHSVSKQRGLESQVCRARQSNESFPAANFEPRHCPDDYGNSATSAPITAMPTDMFQNKTMPLAHSYVENKFLRAIKKDKSKLYSNHQSIMKPAESIESLKAKQLFQETLFSFAGHFFSISYFRRLLGPIFENSSFSFFAEEIRNVIANRALVHSWEYSKTAAVLSNK